MTGYFSGLSPSNARPRSCSSDRGFSTQCRCRCAIRRRQTQKPSRAVIMSVFCSSHARGKEVRGHRTLSGPAPRWCSSTKILFNQDSSQCFHKDIDSGRLPLRESILTFVSPLATANFISRQSELIRLLSCRLFTGVNTRGCHFAATEAVAQT